MREEVAGFVVGVEQFVMHPVLVVEERVEGVVTAAMDGVDPE